jgi:hypothetical protein
MTLPDRLSAALTGRTQDLADAEFLERLQR